MGLQHNANVILVAGDPKPRQYVRIVDGGSPALYVLEFCVWPQFKPSGAAKALMIGGHCLLEADYT